MRREFEALPSHGEVELRVAWRWVCPQCGGVCIHPGQRFPPDMLLEELREKHPGLDERQEAQLLEMADQSWAPLWVGCNRCGGMYTTRVPRFIAGR
jgi:uncharacterized cysteine cluster protein YcgN (CxxCxxCC family)